MSDSVRPHRRKPTRLPCPWGILQARTLEWVAVSFSNAWKWKVKVKSLSRVQLFATPWTSAHQAPPSMGFSRQEYWSGVPMPSPGEGGRAMQRWGLNQAWLAPAGSICLLGLSEPITKLRGTFFPHHLFYILIFHLAWKKKVKVVLSRVWLSATSWTGSR